MKIDSVLDERNNWDLQYDLKRYLPCKCFIDVANNLIVRLDGANFLIKSRDEEPLTKEYTLIDREEFGKHLVQHGFDIARKYLYELVGENKNIIVDVTGRSY